MMQINNKKIIQILIPIIAVVVIFESVMLVNNLEKGNIDQQDKGTPTAEVTPKVNSFHVNFLTDGTAMMVGKNYEVSVVINPRDNYSLNALDLYVKYDPELITVSGLTSLKSTTEKPTLLKVSDKQDVVAMSYLFEDENGLSFSKDVQQTLLTFTATPKKEGNTTLEISSGNEEGNSVTMFVDKVTSEALNFTSDKLEVTLSK